MGCLSDLVWEMDAPCNGLLVSCNYIYTCSIDYFACAFVGDSQAPKTDREDFRRNRKSTRENKKEFYKHKDVNFQLL